MLTICRRSDAMQLKTFLSLLGGYQGNRRRITLLFIFTSMVFLSSAFLLPATTFTFVGAMESMLYVLFNRYLQDQETRNRKARSRRIRQEVHYQR